jgi:hypothetical protein
MAEAGSGSPPDDGLVVTVYARVTGGGFRGALCVRRASDERPLELACELPEIFPQARLAQLAAGEFAVRARAAGTLLSMLEGWEQTRP